MTPEVLLAEHSELYVLIPFVEWLQLVVKEHVPRSRGREGIVGLERIEPAVEVETRLIAVHVDGHSDHDFEELVAEQIPIIEFLTSRLRSLHTCLQTEVMNRGLQ